MIWTYQPWKNPESKKFWLLTGIILFIVGNLLAFYRLSEDFSRLLFSSITFSLAVVFFTFLMLRKPRYYYIEDETIYSASRRTEFSEIEDYTVDRKKLIIKLKINNPSFYKLQKLYFSSTEDLEKVERVLEKIRES